MPEFLSREEIDALLDIAEEAERLENALNALNESNNIQVGKEVYIKNFLTFRYFKVKIVKVLNETQVLVVRDDIYEVINRKHIIPESKNAELEAFISLNARKSELEKELEEVNNKISSIGYI